MFILFWVIIYLTEYLNFHTVVSHFLLNFLPPLEYPNDVPKPLCGFFFVLRFVYTFIHSNQKVQLFAGCFAPAHTDEIDNIYKPAAIFFRKDDILFAS